MAKEVLKYLHTIAFTHRNFEVTKIGLLHIPLDEQNTRLNPVKQDFNLEEMLMLSTGRRPIHAPVFTGSLSIPW
jgi:glutamyl-tRNA reductase